MNRSAIRIASELLVLKAQSGDRAAFEALYRQWNPIVLAHCLRHLRQSADAQDASQKAWLKAMNSLGHLKDPACFPAWLLRIGHLSCIDVIRRQSRRSNLQNQLEQNQTASFDDPEKTLDLRAAIGNLPQGQQEILGLHYSAGFSTAEIGHILGLAAGTVKSRLHTARQKLKTHLTTGEIK